MTTLRYTVALVFGLFLLAGCQEGADEESYSDEMAEQHQDDDTTASAAVREPLIPVETETVAYGAAGAETTGYMAYPARPDSVLEAMGRDPGSPLPALIVVHEWWGLNSNIEAMARRLAGEGFRTLAVDLYHGEVAQNPEEAQELVGLARQNEDDLVANMEAAYQYLEEEYDAPQIGVIGWCFGGGMALEAALAMPTELDAAVIYYGRVGEAGEEALQPLEVPIPGHFGGQDESIPTATVNDFEATLDEFGKEAQIHIYEGAGHAFANPTGQNYSAEAAEAAWDRTTAFLKEYLYGQQEQITPEVE